MEIHPRLSHGPLAGGFLMTVMLIIAMLLPCLSGCDGKSSSPGNSAGEEFARRRAALVEKLGAWGIRDPRVLEAMGAIPRHEFVLPEYRSKSYENFALPIADGQTTSQPSVVARMLELIEFRGDERILEVGTGSGYITALLGRLASEVVSIEIRPSLKEAADKRLERMRSENLLTCKKLDTVLGDGSRGHAASAPYNGIIVTAATATEPQCLLDQLEPGGCLIIPVGGRVQELKFFRKALDGSVTHKCIDIVRFQHLED